MKPIKALLTASALVTVASTANATIWDITMDAELNSEVTQGPLRLTSFQGTWDDETNQGFWHGTLSIPAFATTTWYDQTFSMNEEIGNGHLNTLFNCEDNNGSACTGLSSAFQGSFKNTHGVGEPVNNNSFRKGHAFTPSDGTTLQWSLLLNRFTGEIDPETGTAITEFFPIPMNVTLHAQVPIPAAAWLFGSGLIGLAGAARKRKSA